jgi:polysaccharide biosynthesis transport protein
MNAVAGEAVKAIPGKPFMPLLSWRRHWFLSLSVFVLIAGIGLMVALEKGKPLYYSEAVIHVNFRFAPNLETQQEVETQSVTQYERLVEQQTRVLTRYDIVQAALESLGDDRSRWQAQGEEDDRAIRRLMGSLKVRPVRNTFLLTVGLESEEPDLIPMLVNPLVRYYLDAHREEVFFGSDIRIANLERRRGEIEHEIREDSSELMSMASRIGLTTFEERFTNPYDKILVDMNDAHARAWQNLISAEAELEALRLKHAAILQVDLGAEAEKIAVNDRALGDLRTSLYKRRSELIQIVSGLKPEHPGRAAAQVELEDIEREILSTTVGTRDGIKRILEKQREAEIAIEVAEHEAVLDRARKVERRLAAEVEDRKRKMAEFVAVYNEARNIQEEIDRARTQLKSINNRIDEIEVERNAPGYARLVSLATIPTQAISGGRKRLFAMALVAALGMALILPLLLDMLSTRIRTPVDLHRALGFAPVAWLPENRTARSQALFDDQLHRLAIALMREVREHGAGRSYLVTACVPGAGRSMVTSALADALASLGLATLALDCDADNGASDSREGAPAPGLTALLARTSSIDEALHKAGAGSASRLPFGDADAAQELNNAIRLRDTIEELCGAFDIVLVDGPPLLLSANAEVLASICHGVLIVVAAETTPAGQLRRATRIVERADPEVVASILNRTPLFRGGGYYRKLAVRLDRQQRASGLGG